MLERPPVFVFSMETLPYCTLAYGVGCVCTVSTVCVQTQTQEYTTTTMIDYDCDPNPGTPDPITPTLGLRVPYNPDSGPPWDPIDPLRWVIGATESSHQGYNRLTIFFRPKVSGAQEPNP